MPSTYSPLKIQLMATGENATTWGTITNTNLGTAIEEAITGSADVTFASADVTLTLIDSNASQTARNLRLNLTGTSGGARNLIVPAIEKLYLVSNGTADAVTVKNATGTGIAVPAGRTMFVFNNGTNVVDSVTYLSSLTLGSALPIASGGTGSTTASGARTALGATTLGGNLFTIANPGAITFPRFNADNTVSALDAASFRTAIGAGSGTGTVTSVSGTGTVNGITLTGTVTASGSLTLGGTLSGVSLSTQVTGTLPVANGGTGATTLTGVVIGNGTSAFTVKTNPSGDFVGTTDTQNVTNKTLTTGNTINAGTTISDTGTIGASSPGFRGVPFNSQTGAYTLVLTDAGKAVPNTTGGWAIPANGTTAFPTATTIVLINTSASSQTISITSDTLRWAGVCTTGSRTLAAYGVATIVKVASTEWYITGAGLS